MGQHVLGGITVQQAIFFGILIVAFGLLITERLRIDVIAILLIVALNVTGMLSTEDALRGFSSEPAIVIASVFVLSAGLYRTGLADAVGRLMAHLAGATLGRMLAVIMPISALFSSVTHHVTITAVMLPITLSLSRHGKISPSKLLMPLAVASSLGTTITVLGAPSFLVASQLLQQAGRPGLAIFSIAPIGLALTAAGTLYMALLGRFILPERSGAEDASTRFRLEEYFTELRIVPDSRLAGKTIEELQEAPEYTFTVMGLLRNGHWMYGFRRDRVLEAGDLLLVRASPDDLLAIRQESGVELEPVVQYGENKGGAEGNEEEPDAEDALVQVIVAPQSTLAGRTLSQVDFRRRYGAVVLGMWRKESFVPEELAQTRLQSGDVLVLQGERDALERVSEDPAFLLMVPFQGESRRPRRAIVSGLVMTGAIVAAATGVLSLGMAALTGAVAMVLCGCLTPNQAYRAIDQRMYIFIAGAIPLGTAMQKTGSADLLAGWLKAGVLGWSQSLVLFAIFMAVGVLVQFMGSDSATVALFAPVAIALGAALQQPPEVYVVTVAMAAVTATMTPMGHHNLIIYGPGGYKFFDYTKVGTPLTVVLGAIVAIIAPLLWR
jgi:di/tricarboxylate transporter